MFPVNQKNQHKIRQISLTWEFFPEVAITQRKKLHFIQKIFFFNYVSHDWYLKHLSGNPWYLIIIWKTWDDLSL